MIIFCSVIICRFHPLSEFDEGKRSCRRRLAGHNRRRRKTQPDDVTSRMLLPANRETNNSANADIVNLLTAWARNQGKKRCSKKRCSIVISCSLSLFSVVLTFVILNL